MKKKKLPVLAINSKGMISPLPCIQTATLSPSHHNRQMIPFFFSFWFSWRSIGLLSAHNLCSVCFHNFSGFGIREREGENIFPSINQSICCLKLLFPEQTNSFVCDKYFFSTKFDYFQYFFPIFFFQPRGSSVL